MGRNTASFLFGLGLSIIFAILQIMEVAMPMIVAVLGYIVGGGLMILGIIGFFLKRKPSGATLGTEPELNIDNCKAFVSGIETGEESRITQLTHFIVSVSFTLRIVNPPMHLAWVKLCIAKEEISPFESLPPLRDEISHREESYECKYRVPRNIYLKGRYPDSASIRPEYDECRGHIYIKAGGKDWNSGELSFLYNPPNLR